jgi:hypothetical protein
MNIHIYSRQYLAEVYESWVKLKMNVVEKIKMQIPCHIHFLKTALFAS